MGMDWHGSNFNTNLLNIKTQKSKQDAKIFTRQNAPASQGEMV
jgi:hypothetical protein